MSKSRFLECDGGPLESMAGAIDWVKNRQGENHRKEPLFKTWQAGAGEWCGSEGGGNSRPGLPRGSKAVKQRRDGIQGHGRSSEGLTALWLFVTVNENCNEALLRHCY